MTKEKRYDPNKRLARPHRKVYPRKKEPSFAYIPAKRLKPNNATER